MNSVQSPNLLAEPIFAHAVEEYQRPLFGFLRGFVGDDELALELVQEVFCDAWRAAQRLAPPFVAGCEQEAMRRWLFHTAYCRGVSVLRRRRLIAWVSLERTHSSGQPLPLAPDAFPVAFEESVVENMVLRAALARLIPQDAACVLLHIAHGFTAPEVADLLGISAAAAKKRIMRARQRLRQAYFAENC